MTLIPYRDCNNSTLDTFENQKDLDLKAWAQALEYLAFDYQLDQLIGLRSELAELSGRVDIVERMTAQQTVIQGKQETAFFDAY